VTTLHGVEEAIGDDARDCLVRARIVTDGFRFPLYVPNDAPAAFDARPAAHIRIGSNVDDQTAGNERAVDLMEGIDHALSLDSAERPGEDSHIKAFTSEPQMLCPTDAKAHVLEALAANLRARSADSLRIWVDADDCAGKRRCGDRKPSVTGADVEQPFSPEACRATQLLEFPHAVRAQRASAAGATKRRHPRGTLRPHTLGARDGGTGGGWTRGRVDDRHFIS
jgi:hypothetical protein